jgi:nucleoid DNA-binding protein
MNKTELAAAIAEETGFTKTATYAALTAFEEQLDAESRALRAVVLDDFGTFWPRQKMGQRTGRTLGGGTTTYDNWKLVESPKLVDEATFVGRAAKRADMQAAFFERILQQYKNQVTATLRQGNSVSSHGHGSFKVSTRKPRKNTTVLAARAVAFKSGKAGLHQKFVAVAGLV